MTRRVLLALAVIVVALIAFAPATVDGRRKNRQITCETFKDQAEAQAFLRDDPTDPYGLVESDPSNGIACESYIDSYYKRGAPTDLRPVFPETQPTPGPEPTVPTPRTPMDFGPNMSPAVAAYLDHCQLVVVSRWAVAAAGCPPPAYSWGFTIPMTSPPMRPGIYFPQPWQRVR